MEDEYYANGTLRTTYNKNIKIGYWPSGKKEYEFTYAVSRNISNNTQERLNLIAYWNNAHNTLQYKCKFVNNQKSGNEEWFYENEKPSEIKPFVNGILDGVGYYWDPYDNKSEIIYKNGKVISTKKV